MVSARAWIRVWVEERDEEARAVIAWAVSAAR
jgi:hypothetical protein